MKIKLEIILEAPDSYNDWTHGELLMNFSEQFVNIPKTDHLIRAIDSYDEPNNARKKAALKHHQEWAKISTPISWTLTKLND